MEKMMTRGERKIRPDFAKTDEVKEVKALYTLLYDKIANIEQKIYEDAPHMNKHFDGMDATKKALDHLETSAMYAVKALTV